MQSRVYTFPNATVRVNYPDITDSENEKRLQQIKRTAEKLLREIINAEELRNKRKENGE